MALVKRTDLQATPSFEGMPSLVTTRAAEAQRKKASKLAKQQQRRSAFRKLRDNWLRALPKHHRPPSN